MLPGNGSKRNMPVVICSSSAVVCNLVMLQYLNHVPDTWFKSFTFYHFTAFPYFWMDPTSVYGNDNDKASILLSQFCVLSYALTNLIAHINPSFQITFLKSSSQICFLVSRKK